MRLSATCESRVSAVWGWSCIVPSIHPLGYCDAHFFVTGTVTVVWVQVWAYSFEGTPKAQFVEKVERSDRGKCDPVYCHPPMFPLDAEILQEGFHMRGIYHSTDPNVYYPSFIGVVAAK